MLNDESGALGGNFLTVQFKGVPESVYLAWIYRLGTGTWEIRAWQRTACSQAEQRWAEARFGALYASESGV